MINANELRIGNWVLAPRINDYYTGGIIKVEEILCDGIERTQGDSTAYEFEKLDGIPLTPEIFEKCRGEKFDKLILRWDYLNKGKLLLFFQGSGENEIGNKNYFIPIHSLHQLQNLYFALTGEELEINL